VAYAVANIRRAMLTEHELEERGERQAPRAGRLVLQFDDEELDRRVRCHERMQLARDNTLRVVEDAVPETMTGAVGRLPAARQRRRGPKASIGLVPDVQGFAALVRDRIIVPARHGITQSTFEHGVCDS